MGASGGGEEGDGVGGRVLGSSDGWARSVEKDETVGMTQTDDLRHFDGEERARTGGTGDEGDDRGNDGW